LLSNPLRSEIVDADVDKSKTLEALLEIQSRGDLPAAKQERLARRIQTLCAELSDSDLQSANGAAKSPRSEP
jgi:hypothetical protein